MIAANRTASILAALLFTTGAAMAQARLVEKVAAKDGSLVIPYEKYVYPNGLTLVVHEDHSDPIVHVDVTYHVGSAREEIGKSGFAHFFEHMMFQGSDNVKKGEHFKIITESGGTLNGTTNRDRTNYFETVPSNQLEKMLWLESDRMGYLLDAVTQEKFENQRSTVKNERGQNYDNRPYGLAFEYLSRNMYPYGHPYSWLTIGYVEDLNRVDVNDLKNFFLRWYGPNNATITIGGDVKTAEVVGLVQKYFGDIPKGPAVKKTVLPAVKLDKDRYASYVDNYARIPLLIKGYATVPEYHKDVAPLACLAQILGQGKNSVMYQELVKTQKVLQANVLPQHSELAGEFLVQVVPYPGKGLAQLDSMYASVLAAFEKRGVTEEDIARFKGGIESQYVNRLQSVAGKVSQLAAFQTFTGSPNRIGSQLQAYLSVTREDVLRVYDKYVKGRNSLTLSVVPKGQEKLVAGPDNHRIDSSRYKAPDYGYAGLTYNKRKSDFDRSLQPGNGPNPVVKVPPFWKKTTAKGIEMIGTLNAELPTVTLLVRLPGGHLAQATDTGRIGLSSMTAAMLNEDTKNFTAEQMSVELQKLGSTVNVSSDRDGINFTVQTLKKNLGKTLGLLEERIFRPEFTQDAFNRLQKQALESFKQQKSQPAAVADVVWDRINYGPGNILGMSEDGNERSVKGLKLEDVRNCYLQHLASRGAQVIVVGDVAQGEIEPMLGFLSALPDKSVSLVKPAAAPAVEKTRIFLVDVPKAAQTEFRIGGVTGLGYDATGEYYRSSLMNYPLGGSFNSVLNQNLRETKGWTYGARSAFSGDRYTGEYTFSSGIRADATDSALADILRDMKAYALNGMKPEDLAFTKSAIGQRDALQYETGIQKASFISRILEYGLPADYVELQSKILSSITKEELDALARKWIRPDNLNILLVGDKAKILPGLQKFGYDIVELDTDGNPKK